MIVRRKFVAVFSIVAAMMFSSAGCSGDSISKIEIMNNGIKTNYIVKDVINVSDFELKLTTKNNNEKIYYIEDEMVTIGDYDNTILGNQNVPVSIDYNGTIIELVLSVSFSLPDDVKNIISLIDELPEEENINFDHEQDIEFIEEKYDEMEDKYKEYISNFDKYEDARDSLDELLDQYITTEFINRRFTLRTNIDNLLASMSKTDYSNNGWNLIISYYDHGINELYKNKNHDRVDEIVQETINAIKSVKTIAVLNLEYHMSVRIYDLKEIRNGLSSEYYSSENIVALNNIVSSFETNVVSKTSVAEIDELYFDAVEELNNVPTLDEEDIQSLKDFKESKTNDVKNIFADLDLSKYSSANRNNLISLYNTCLENIKNAENKNAIYDFVRTFNFDVSKVKTLDEERLIELNIRKSQLISAVNEYYEELNIYKYDTKNQNLINGYLETAISKINDALSVDEAGAAYTEFVALADAVPTMLEAATANLPVIKNAAKDVINNYFIGLNSADYSASNWQTIVTITTEGLESLDNNIRVDTQSTAIQTMINKIINDIDAVLTIEEEAEKLLSETKTMQIKRIDDYKKSLRANQFAEGKYEYVINKIENTKLIIESLTSVESVVNLVDDTIDIINRAKIQN